MLRKTIYALVGAMVLGLLTWSFLLSQWPNIEDANLYAITLAVTAVGLIGGYILGNKATATFGSTETINSLRAFFIFIGLIGVFGLVNMGVSEADELRTTFNTDILTIVSAIIGLINLYIGVNLKNILTNHLGTILKFIYIQLAIIVVTGAFRAISGEFSATMVAWLVLEAVILYKLIAGLKQVGPQAN